MNSLFFIFLKRIRLPIILLILSYAVVILGFVLIPGQDDQGNVWHMSFFHAFYFVSFMGTTIGFGEIPYEFTNAQRMWTIFSIYATVTIWLYSIGAILSTLQNPAFKRILKENDFRKKVAHIREPFYLICGYGDTGKLLAHELSANNILSVVLDIDPERIDNLEIDEPDIDIPALAANASFPEVLETAGLTHNCCQGVIALTNKDEVNLKIAITARLLNKERMLQDHLMVVCRAESVEVEANMASFGTSHIINPFDIYARRLALSVRSPSAYLVYEWLTNPYHKVRKEPIKPPRGTWVICGYGRFGKAISRHLNYVGIKTVIIEAEPDATRSPEGTIIGRGTEAVTLREAKITEAVAIVAGTDNDANNLSIVLSAQDEIKHYYRGKKRDREYYDKYYIKNTDYQGDIKHNNVSEQTEGKLFSIARQNFSRNKKVFEKAELDFIMQPASIIAGEILSIIKTPLLSTFLSLARRQKDEWANVLISRISSFIDNTATTWMVEISEKQTPAVMYFLKQDKISVREITSHPRSRDRLLNCVVLLVHRKKNKESLRRYEMSDRRNASKYNNFLLPKKDFEIQEGDQLLICGDKESMHLMCWTVSNINVYNYIHSGYELAGSYIGVWFDKMKKKYNRETIE
ncbi:MAG: potassium channel family protein [Thiotrichaceae bacterium]|nr:potassium channel family protein [Thiotrichaceae bacterium]